MPAINNILSALCDFLTEIQSLGIIKDFNLVPCEQQDKEISLKAEKSFTCFLHKIGYASEETQCSKEVKEIPSKGKQSTNEMQSESNKISTNPEVASIESPTKKNLVQITVDSNEMKRRINAFTSRKKGEGAEWNVQEFCGRSYIDEQDPAWENLDSCARVDSVFVQRRGLKSHIKVSKVRNTCGPQTQPQSGAKKIKLEPTENEGQTNDASLKTIDERLLHMETHLKLKTDSNLRGNIFKRLKALENRILFLESTSPEYIQHLPDTDTISPKKKNNSDKDKIYSNYSTEEVRKKIQTLKETLKIIKVEPYF